MEDKKLYKGLFNWYGEVYTVYVRVHSKVQAKLLMGKDLSPILGYSSVFIGHYFKDKDNYQIEEVNDAS